jgi:hypothetical protein
MIIVPKPIPPDELAALANAERINGKQINEETFLKLLSHIKYLEEKCKSLVPEDDTKIYVVLIKGIGSKNFYGTGFAERDDNITERIEHARKFNTAADAMLWAEEYIRYLARRGIDPTDRNITALPHQIKGSVYKENLS